MHSICTDKKAPSACTLDGKVCEHPSRQYAFKLILTAMTQGVMGDCCAMEATQTQMRLECKTERAHSLADEAAGLRVADEHARGRVGRRRVGALLMLVHARMHLEKRLLQGQITCVKIVASI